MWSLTEQDAMDKALAPHSPLRTALEKFCEARADARRRECTDYMQTVPRQFELASDVAAKAQVYAGLVRELELELEK